jgi:hypothetical protein
MRPAAHGRFETLALDPTDHELIDPETLHIRIARYVAVRRERGEQMKVIVPARPLCVRPGCMALW